MYFGNNTQVNPPYTKQELENVKKSQERRRQQALQDDINKAYENIRFCNEKLNDSEFIKSQTPENVKALVLLRIQFTEEADRLVAKVK